MTPDEKRGYSKGYAAGQRRTTHNGQLEKRAAMREDFIQRMMIAIAPQMIARPWGNEVNGEWKAHRGGVEIMASVRAVASVAADQCSFVVPAEPEAAQ